MVEGTQHLVDQRQGETSDYYPAEGVPAPARVVVVNNAPMPIAQPALAPARPAMRLDTFNYSLYGCCEEPCMCLKATVFPCCLMDDIAQVRDYPYVHKPCSHWSICPGCVQDCSRQGVHGCLMYSMNHASGCPLLQCYIAAERKQSRQLWGIPGHLCDDLLAACLCTPCALVQELREAQARLAGQVAGHVQGAPVQQRMAMAGAMYEVHRPGAAGFVHHEQQEGEQEGYNAHLAPPPAHVTLDSYRQAQAINNNI